MPIVCRDAPVGLFLVFTMGIDWFMDISMSNLTYCESGKTYTFKGPAIFERVNASDTLCIAHVYYCANSGCGKREVHENLSLVKPEKAAPITGATLTTTSSVPVDSRQ